MDERIRQAYPSDLSDVQWGQLASLFDTVRNAQGLCDNTLILVFSDNCPEPKVSPQKIHPQIDADFRRLRFWANP